MTDYIPSIELAMYVPEESYFKYFPEGVPLTKEKVEDSLELLISVGLDQETRINWDRSHPTKPVANRIKQHKDWLYMIDCELSICDLGQNLTLVNDKYIYSHKTGKWRARGRGKWYKSKDLDTFIFKYVLSIAEAKANAED